MVVGDVILDRYIQGSVSRISPEAPVPVVLEESFSYQPGGAANVAHNLAALGAKVTQVGKTGFDFEGQLLKRDLKRKGIDISGIFSDRKMATITKTRVIAQHQQVVRIDREKPVIRPDAALDKKVASFIEERLKKTDAVIVSDYGKGLITPKMVEAVRDRALAYKIPITVDPKVEHFACYRNVTCITPNLKEAENAIRNIKIREADAQELGLSSDRLYSMKDVERAGDRLLKYLNLESLLITLGERGMCLFEKGKAPYGIDTRAQEVYDVTGAGDAVISVFTLALTAGANKQKAAELANYAAGVVVGKMGAVAVSPEELSDAIKGAL